MLLKLAWRNIWRNKRRSLITAASVMFAVFFAVVLRSVQLGTYENMIANVVGSSTGYIQVHQKGYWDEGTLEYSLAGSDSLLETLQSTEGVSALVPRLESFSLVSTGEVTKGMLIMGVDPEKEKQLSDLTEDMIAGEIFDLNDRSIILSQGSAEYFEVSPGDTVVLIGQGYHGVSANGKYAVSGIVKMRSPELNKQLAFLPLPEAQALYGAYDRFSSYIIIPGDAGEFQDIAARLRARTDTSAYEVMTWKEMMPELVQAIEADSSGGLIMLFILYMVVSFGIFGTILMMTAERTKEYGILMAIGMKRHQLAIITVLETFLLSLTGILAGAVLAMPLVFYYHYNPINLSGSAGSALEDYGFEPLIPASTDISIPLTHGAAVLVISFLLSLYAVWNIYRLKVVKAMRV